MKEKEQGKGKDGNRGVEEGERGAMAIQASRIPASSSVDCLKTKENMIGLLWNCLRSGGCS